MAEWTWVALGYGITAAAVGGYVLSLIRQWRRTGGRS